MSCRAEMERNRQEMIPGQRKDNNPAPKQTKTAMFESRLKEAIMETPTPDMYSTKGRRIMLSFSLRVSRPDIKQMDGDVVGQEQVVKHLACIIERENYIHEDFIRKSEKQSMDARTQMKKEKQAKKEKTAMIEKLIDKVRTMKSELAETEEVQNKYKKYNNLFKLSSPEQQAAQAAVKDTQHEQNEGAQESETRQGLESSQGGVMPWSREAAPLAHDDRHPQQVVDLRRELTDQVLSQIHNSAKVDEALEELQQNIETSLKKIQGKEEKLALQVDHTKDRIDKEKDRAAELKKKVLLHDALKAKDQDVLLDDIGVMVTEVYLCCLEKQMGYFSTLEKLSKIEFRLSSQLLFIESMPEESLKTLRKIKDSERIGRLREEQLRLEREKQKERMKKCMQRSLGVPKKISGRKLMPRCFPVKQKVQVSSDAKTAAEDELHNYLFTTEDVV